MKNLEQCIKDIIADSKKFSAGDCFDSHTIINELQNNKEYFQAYLNEHTKNQDVAQYHSTIAKMIRDCGLVSPVQIDGKDLLIKTHTIFGEISENHVWKKN